MASRSPIFPVPEPQHYSDYGFDPQIDYFQVLEEARRHGKRPAEPDAIHFTQRKPIAKDERGPKSKKRRKWWKAAFLFWKRDSSKGAGADDHNVTPAHSYPHRPMSGPVYMIESSGSGSSTPCRTSRPSSGPLRAAEVGAQAGIPYLSLRDLNLVEGHRSSASAPAPPPMPIYLVT